MQQLDVQYLFDDKDEIDWARPRRSTPATGRRQCAACALTYVVALEYAGPPLCEGCRTDMGGTKARLRRDLESEQVQERAALAAWDAAREPHQVHWDRIQDARGQPDYAARAARHKAAGGVYGLLLIAEEDYTRALDRLGAERERLERALIAIDEGA